MKTRSAVATLSVPALVLALLSGARAAEIPPANAKPLSTILASVQEQAIGSVAEAEFDDGRWEVTVCASNACQKLYINPRTGLEEGRRSTGLEQTPAAGSTPVTTIVRRVEAANVGVVIAADFDHGHWKLELAVPPTSTP